MSRAVCVSGGNGGWSRGRECRASARDVGKSSVHPADPLGGVVSLWGGSVLTFVRQGGVVYGLRASG